MNKDQIKARVKTFILDEFLPGEDPQSLTDEIALISDGILDSMASLKLVSYLEESFEISIPAHQIDEEHLNTLDLIAETVAMNKND
ncbi:phosphopantetheine-binding protein [Pseudohalocynthiibacter sp. F2068]|jgi:acyl carrier protein|uniref:acyl carrier protein n=1 Tax=Pseudohalocynthiibacter sp. F2068 TaxID=2926418 RepID=UPI001FF4710C|nr:phosphopantetheine-binding protein [Pseudohalocynthiibacter sp. F2068]MCK0103944.1 phosphopantetheine-binding protein [Pseudohalocynthiibacter sp. F2068]